MLLLLEELPVKSFGGPKGTEESKDTTYLRKANETLQNFLDQTG